MLSAFTLHERFTAENQSPMPRLTRLMVLCACSSGKRLEMQQRITAISGGSSKEGRLS